MPNYRVANRVNKFCNRNGGCVKPKSQRPPDSDIPPLDISTKNSYLIALTYVVNDNNSVTFSGNINKSNFNITGFDVFPNNTNYSIDYTFNNKTGALEFTLQNYSNDANITLYIQGNTQFAQTTHNITYYYNHVIN